MSANKTKAKSRETTRVGRTVRDWRERANLTREELAMKTGRCLSTIRNWEKDREPRVSDLIMLEDIRPGLIRALFPDAFRRRLARHSVNGVARSSAHA